MSSKLPDICSVADLNALMQEQWKLSMPPLTIDLTPQDRFKSDKFIPVICVGCGERWKIRADAIPDLREIGHVCDSCKFPSSLLKNRPVEAPPVPTIESPEEAQAAQLDPTPEPPVVIEENPSRSEKSSQGEVELPVEVAELNPEPVRAPAVMPELTEAEKQLLMADHEVEVLNKIGDIIGGLEEALGYPVFGTNIEWKPRFLNGKAVFTQIEVRCLICGDTNVWDNEEEFFDESRGFSAFVSIGDMPGHTSEDIVHNCKNCLAKLDENAGNNPYILATITAEAAVKGLRVVTEELTGLHSPLIRVSMIGENDQTLVASLEELRVSQIPDGYYKKKEAKKKQPPKVAPTPAPVEETVHATEAIAQENLSAAQSTTDLPWLDEKSLDVNSMFGDVAEVVKPQERKQAPTPTAVLPDHSAIHEKDSLRGEEELRMEAAERQDEQRVFGKKNRIMNPKVNPFLRADYMVNGFQKSNAGSIIQEVQRLTGIPYFLHINESTLEIPVVDFESGIRVICLDLEKPTMANLPEGFDNRVPFFYKNTEFKKFYLFSDSAQYRSTATILNLSKVVQGYQAGEAGFPEDYVVSLADFTTFYTTDAYTLADFEQKNCSSPNGKPYNGRILLLALREVQKQMSESELMKFLLSNRKTFQDMSMYGVASMRWIALPKNGQVEYTITQYVEIGETWIRDGFTKSLAALAKEHMKNFGDMPYHVTYEYDRTAFVSPSVYQAQKDGVLIPIPTYGVNNNDWVYIKDYSPEFHLSAIDNMRQDQRFFTRATMISRYSDAIKESGVNIRDNQGLAFFIKSLGFIRCLQPELVRFFVNPMNVATASFEAWGLFEIDPTTFLSGGISSNGDDMNSSAQNMLMMQFMMQQMSGEQSEQSSEQPENSSSSNQESTAENDLMQQIAFMSAFGLI